MSQGEGSVAVSVTEVYEWGLGEWWARTPWWRRVWAALTGRLTERDMTTLLSTFASISREVARHVREAAILSHRAGSA